MSTGLIDAACTLMSISFGESVFGKSRLIVLSGDDAQVETKDNVEDGSAIGLKFIPYMRSIGCRFAYIVWRESKFRQYSASPYNVYARVI
jgi:hypothetical protein